MSCSPSNLSGSNGTTSCACTSTPADKRTPVANSVDANTLADSLGVSPLYRQQDSARWQSAAQVYQSSRAHSPVLGGSATPNQFNYGESNSSSVVTSVPVIECVTPRQLHQTYYQQTSSAVNSPISLEDIASVNRRRHQEVGDKRIQEAKSGALELEAIAAVHELACSVKAISVSEILPRTADLIFVNIKTHEDQTFTLELTLKGWRIASVHSDSMNGDYSNVELHTRYFHNAREVLEKISPGHTFHFNDCLAERLKQLEKNKENEDV